MRTTFILTMLGLITLLLQYGIMPVLLPQGWIFDLGLAVALTAAILLPIRTGLWFAFCMGLMADLFDAGRFGLMTFAFLSATLVLLPIRDKAFRFGPLTIWLTIACGTLIAHTGYALGLGVLEKSLQLGLPLDRIKTLFMGALLAGWAVCYALYQIFRYLELFGPEAQEHCQKQIRRELRPRNVPRFTKTLRV